MGDDEKVRRYAFLIGCDEYRNFSNIAFCCADVELVRDTLVTYCDYEDKDIECSMQYPECDETPDDIYEKISSVVTSCENGDSFLFYFAGHGVKEGEKGYLLLADSISSNYAETALDLGKINELIRIPKINGYLILDACHSGILARNAFSESVINSISDTGCITLASCSENEESNPYPEKQQGVFTYYLCEEIKRVTPGTPVLIEKLKINVCEKVDEWSHINYKKQTPTLNGQIVGNNAIAIRNQNGYNGLPQLTVDILDTASPALYTHVLKKWLADNTKIQISSVMPNNTEWRVFGQYYVYLAYDNEQTPWIVMINVLKKYNYSNVLHALTNLDEIRTYYSRFGKSYKYYQIIIISKGNEKKFEHTISVQRKLKRKFNNKEIMNTVAYLQEGKINPVFANYALEKNS